MGISGGRTTTLDLGGLAMSLLEAFVRLAMGIAQGGFTIQTKNKFHRDGKKVAKALATALGLDPGTYEVRSNKAGFGVCGEVTLHGERVYVQFSGDSFHGILYRSCKSRHDYTGGSNQWMEWDTLADLDTAAATIRYR